MRCPSCASPLGDVVISGPHAERSIACAACDFVLARDGDGWDASVDRNHTREFSRQWRLWESGKLGDPRLIYGMRPEELLTGLLRSIDLTAEQLGSLRVLEIGFGNGALLSQLQKHCPDAYGIDLAVGPVSASLRPGSTIHGSLFQIPFMPGQFDVVVCHGVIHHTEDASRAFACVAEQVAEHGACSLTVYAPNSKGSLVLRSLLPSSWRYPERVRLAISGALGLPRAALECFRTRQFDAESFAAYHGNATLGIFDVISPRWTSQHSGAEVISWFEAQGLRVKQLGDTHYVGTRGQPRP